MIEILRHRGPDDTGYFFDHKIGLGNARLSIIDVEGGHQPIHNETGSIQATFNGAIYNFVSLREELEKHGHRFYTKSDGEVIVHGYEEYGVDFVKKLNGMFAIAIWDSIRKRLLLIRDRMGIKPLYYAYHDGTFLFASEIKAILQAPIRRIVDEDSLYSILNLGYVTGHRTMLDGIMKLPPSSMLVYENNDSRIQAYWHLTALDHNIDRTHLVSQLQSILSQVVSDQLVADVPVGCLLSGGLDSSTIVAHASMANKNKPLKTFCMGFGQETDELRDARIIADKFGTDHHELTIDSSQGMKLYPRMVWHMEAPAYDLFPWFVYEMTRRFVKVCLSGTGGDEVFGGYTNRYLYALRIQRLSAARISGLLRGLGRILERIPTHIEVQRRLRVLDSLNDEVGCYFALNGSLPDTVARKLFKKAPDHRTLSRLREHFSSFFGEQDFLQSLINADLQTRLVNQFLAADDSNSMAHSLELRVPFLDNRIVDLMSPVPWSMKYAPPNTGKLPLREAVQQILPKEILSKPKQPFFSINVHEWFKGELGELARQLLPESDVITRYFSKDYVKQLLSKRQAPWDRRYQLLFWQLLGFHFWHRMFVDAERIQSPRSNLNKLS
jgi:asparagine synthase (glutamine-hydrolysing)